MTVPKYHFPAGSEVTLGGSRLVLSGTEGAGYAATDLDTGEERFVPLLTMVEFLKLPSTKIDIGVTSTRNRIRDRLGGLSSSKGCSKDSLTDAEIDVATCRALAILQEEMRAEIGNKAWRLSGRFIDGKREEIKKMVYDLTGIELRLIVPRGRNGAGRHYLLKGRKLREKFELFEKLEPTEAPTDAMVPLNHLKGNRTSRIPPRLRELMTQAWEEVGLDTKKPSVASVKRHLEVLIDEENVRRERNDLSLLTIPATSTVSEHRKRIVSATAYLVATTGERHARKKRGRGSTDVRALFIGEYIEIDECKASLVVSAKARGIWENFGTKDRETLEKIDKEIRERLFILVAIDVATRMPLAWVISDQPRAQATLALLRMATRSKDLEKEIYGCEGEALPGTGLGHIKNDNGHGLRDSTIIASHMGAGIMNTVARVHSPTDRPYIERMFGTMESVLLQLIHGYTGRRPGHLPDYDAQANGVLEIETLMGILTRFMIDEYPAMRHTGIGMGGRRPIEVFKEINETRGCVAPMDPNTRRIHFGWEVRTTPTDEGVKVFSGIWFNSDELQECREGRKGKVSVFVDPDDLNNATVIMSGVADPITVTLQITAFADMTLPGVLQLMQIWRREDPRKTDIYEDRLIRIRRERQAELQVIGVEKKLNRSYSTLEECTRKARALFLGARILRTHPIEGTVPAGQVADLSSDVGILRLGGDETVIEGEFRSAGAIDPWSEDGSDEDVVPTTNRDAAEGDVAVTPQPKRPSPRKPKASQQQPIALGRPTKLKDLE